MATADPRLTKTQLETLRRMLEEERARILGVLAASTPPSPSEDERAEFEEVAQRSTEGDDRFGVAERERALLAEVDRALAKLDSGRYGLSERTGAPIPYARLSSVPWARAGVDEE